MWRETAQNKTKEVRDLKAKIAELEKSGAGDGRLAASEVPQEPVEVYEEISKLQDDRDRAVKEKLDLKRKFKEEIDELKESLKQLQEELASKVEGMNQISL